MSLLPRISIACILVATLWPAVGLGAEDAWTSMFSFGGFGTFGLVHSNDDKADFTSSPFEVVGAGHTHAWSPAVDSRIAAQVTATFNPRFSAVVQVIAEQNYDNTYVPHVEWANVKFQVMPDLSVRVGRTGEPLFLVNDSRKIGYANPWVRPPIELYTLVPVTVNDGLDATYRLSIGPATNTFQATVGQANYKYPTAGGGGVETAKARGQAVFVDSIQRGTATLRFTYGQADVTVPQLRPLFAAFRQFGPQGAGLADRYDVNGRIIRFFGVSASYEPGNWFATGEWGRIITHSVLGDKTGWYLSGGHRFGQVTPYVNYAHLNADSDTSDPGLSLAALPPPQAAIAGGLNGTLNAALATIAVQKTISIGARWDFMRDMDLKLQYGRISLGAHSPGTLTNLQPGFHPGINVSIFSATFDFVF